jgi:hypothetical protein
MGKFVEEKDLIEGYLDNYIDTTSDFSRFIEGSPNFVTYYSKDISASTEDIPLQGVLETVGSESPLKYNRIENFPVYNLDEFNPATSVGENGISTEIESTGIILPDTIQPLPNDYFLVGYLNEDYLFRVVNVETNSINNRVFYRISYILSNDSLNILEERQVTDSYRVVYENLGKKEKSVIKETDFLLLDKLDDRFQDLQENYVKLFYNKDYNSFIFRNYMYDNFLARFINQNSLFISTKTYMKNIHVEPILREDFEAYEMYEQTVFSALEKRSARELQDIVYDLNEIKQPGSIFAIFRNRYAINRMDYRVADDRDVNFLVKKDFLKDVNESTVLEGEDLVLPNFIVQYLNSTLSGDELVGYLDGRKFKLARLNYTLIPCILFILKEMKQDIMNK